jgi:hypothetical protein
MSALLACRIGHKVEQAQCEMTRLTCVLLARAAEGFSGGAQSSLTVLKWIKFPLWNVIFQFLQIKVLASWNSWTEYCSCNSIIKKKKIATTTQQHCKFLNAQRVTCNALGDICKAQQFWRFFFLLFNYLENRKTCGKSVNRYKMCFIFLYNLYLKHFNKIPKYTISY